jgi:uncharacterized protein
MKIPDVPCQINVYCEVNLSEDPKKIQQAITNILGEIDVKVKKESISASSYNLKSLKKIYESIHSHHSKNAYRRQLNQNLKIDSSWFYLNKQAAFANTVALCSEYEESPLGPIKVTLNSKNIDQVIDWLILNSE